MRSLEPLHPTASHEMKEDGSHISRRTAGRHLATRSYGLRNQTRKPRVLVVMVVVMIMVIVMMIVIMVVMIMIMVIMIMVIVFVVVMMHVGRHDTCQADRVMWMIGAVTAAIVLCRGRSREEGNCARDQLSRQQQK